MRCTAAILVGLGLVSSIALVFVPAFDVQAAPKDTVCMSAMTKGVREGKEFTILVSPERVAEFESRGFTAHECEGKENSLPQYERDICELSHKAPATVQASFVEVYAVAPGELCQMARALKGR
ncbi:MAG: hypothetical protein H6918_05525 [Sphingomonadaceae bacterium]|nr:hypothetical protein [Sphingomonadaceae bacterium]